MWAKLRVLLLVVIDAILINFGFVIAFFLRFLEEGFPLEYYITFKDLFLAGTFIYLCSFFLFKLYNRVWSYASTGELLAIINAVTVGALGIITMSFLYQYTKFFTTPLPRSVFILSWAFTIILIGGTRFSWRMYIDKKRDLGSIVGRRALIIGAGDAGAMVARELSHNRNTDLRAVAFIDDDPAKKNQSLLGIPVLGDRDEILKAVKNYSIDKIIIAMPSVGGQAIREIMEICHLASVKAKILPGVYEIIDGKVTIDRLRPVQLEDLLHRESINVDLEGIADYVKNRVVLVTGAGGSIGSELCWQIAPFTPKRLIILGHGENSIHKIWHELQQSFPELEIAVEIADVRDCSRIEYIFKKHRPAVVFHAAAHKHVPLMEMHPLEAVKTNVLGTRNVAKAAHHSGTKIFIFISTDKAVNPSSVMGASKLLGELLIRQMNNQSETIFAAVRFGNVLGSKGSVVPIFREQIRRGGPVMVTHPEMTRYFMTIPEAVTLVIQAGTMANDGEVFVLDIGEPVKIINLAKDMIKLSGYEPGVDIEIIYTGIRPGEKLYEELLTSEEVASATCHEKIFVARPYLVDAMALEKELANLEVQTQYIDGERLFQSLRRIVPGFKDCRGQYDVLEIDTDKRTATQKSVFQI